LSKRDGVLRPASAPALKRSPGSGADASSMPKPASYHSKESSRSAPKAEPVLADLREFLLRLWRFRASTGGRDQRRDEPTPARFHAALDLDRDRTRGRVVILFLRRGGVSAIDLPQRGRFYRGDGLPVRLEQFGPRTRHHHRRADRLAIRCRRVRGRLDNDRAADRHATRRHKPQSDRGSAAS
jgi:hypothetical protein